MDRNNLKTYQIGPSDALRLTEKIQLTNTIGAINNFSLLNDSLYIARVPALPGEINEFGNYKDEFVFLYPEEKTGETFGEFPTPNFEFDEPYQIVFYYHKIVEVNRVKKRIIAFYTRVPLIKIFDFDGKLLKEIEFDVFTPIDQKLRWITFEHSNVTDNYVYVLYGNERIPENLDEYEPKLKDLLILNWEGEVLKRYDLNVLISDFAVSEKHKKIYALPIYGGESIIEFDLPEM